MIADHNNVNAHLLAMSVVDHIPAMIAYWDKDLICRFANAPYLKWFGQKSEDMIGKMTIRELLGPLYEKNLPFITGVLHGEPQTFEREIPLPSGETRSTLANYFPDIKDGEVKGFFVHVGDVHDLKMLQKDLIRSNEVVIDQNKRLHNFANIVSHNLKSYASNLDSLLKLFLSAESVEEKDLIINYLGDLSSGFTSTVAHLTEIVDSQNLQKKDAVACILIVFVSETIAILKMQIESSNASISINIEPGLTLVTNPTYLQSIILNLLTNALKYRSPDRMPVIQISAYNENEQTVFEVKDNGLGIDLKQHGVSMFGMNKTFHGNVDATGLGLYMTKFQVNSLGGSIDVESEVNVGTVFRVIFKKKKS